ncbi:PREDICTED: centrosomal protein of 164 kDa isoform X1 [Papilio xuthus]|uniref:Centrosomal protein of 164 kDa isoform X1 n=1 Tax=Papilio xuthus TaxID=66420 RepID=A0AAJ6ZI68_PAPXU|nr:PREDICTED: centrosomal protein of 164 kDa isoform X1 [Papilio xuthus]
MSSPSAIVCREIFDESSQPSADEISEYAQQLGIDPESESHLLPLAREGLMQALPPPWKAYFDEKLQTHYYYNEDTKNTQWEHPLDTVYRELVKKARDASMHDDTCASVQELPTSEDNTKNLERVETKVESDDDDLSTDSENHPSDVKDAVNAAQRRLTPLGRPPLAPLSRLDKKLSDLRISPLRRSVEGPISPKPALVRNTSDRDLFSRPTFERPKMLFKQQSEIIDLKMHVLSSPEEENFSPLLSTAKIDKGLPFSGKGNMFMRLCKSDLPSPDTEKSLPGDSVTKSDPPKGILREKSDSFQRKHESAILGRPKQTYSFDEDKKSVRFKLENVPEPTVSPGSNSSSDQNEGQSSIISAPPVSIPSTLVSSPIIPSSPVVPSPVPLSPSPSPVPTMLNNVHLSPLVARPPLPPRPHIAESPREPKSSSEKDSFDGDSRDKSPRRRLLKPSPSDYIKPDLFQKNFQKISDLVRRGDGDSAPVNIEEPGSDKEGRPRSPMIPQKNKISINLMESIDSETSIDSPDREFANIDLNDLDESNESHESQKKDKSDKSIDNEKSPKESEDSLHNHSKTSEPSPIRPQRISDMPIPQIKVPKLDFLSKQSKFTHSDSEDSRKSNREDEVKTTPRSNSIDIPKDIKTQIKLSPTPSLGSDRSSRLDFGKNFSPLSTFKPLKLTTQNKSSDSMSLGKTSPRLDGVIISQGKSSSDNVVVVYQFETQEESCSKPIKSPLIPDMGTRDFIERNRNDEKRRLELSLQKELELIRMEWSAKEKKMRAELQEEIKEAEQKFLTEKRIRLNEQADRHKRDMEEELSTAEHNHKQMLQDALNKLEKRHQEQVEATETQHAENMARLREDYKIKLADETESLEIDNERALCELREQLQMSLNRERTRMIEENRATIETLREEHTTRITELRHDYRAEVERLRGQHACHVEEVRARLAGERAAAARSARTSPHERDRALADKYRCLKEKYARLKHDVKMSIERRNKRREMSMTTGSETEKSNSHKATQSIEKCKEANEKSISVVIETEPRVIRNNNTVRCNDNETSASESNAHKSDNNNEWKLKTNILQSAESSLTSGAKAPRRRTAVAFREPPRSDRDRDRDRDRDAGATTDYQDSSDATTADEKPKETINGHGRRRCFTRLKSASTSRLNYSPKRGEGWSSPLESLRQQLRKLDDLEDQFPDLACQPAYSLRYPFSELGAVNTANTPELEFVRHRALVEREGMRRARAVLKRRRAALRDSRANLSPHRATSEDRESTELEVALHRARALLGEKEIRLRHIERALRRLAEDLPYPTPHTHPPLIQETTTSEASSGSEGGDVVEGVAGLETSGAVLRSLRALHADVRDIWRALDARRPNTASPETSSYNVATTSQTRMTLSAPDPMINETSDGVTERAKGLRAWLQTAP